MAASLCKAWLFLALTVPGNIKLVPVSAFSSGKPFLKSICSTGYRSMSQRQTRNWSITNKSSSSSSNKRTHNFSSKHRPSLDDIERLSRGQAAKQRGTGSRGVPHRLNAAERTEWELAKTRKFLQLRGSGWRRERGASPLSNIYRNYCDALAIPCITLMRAVGTGRVMSSDSSSFVRTNNETPQQQEQQLVDQVTIDFSPLRFSSCSRVEADGSEDIFVLLRKQCEQVIADKSWSRGIGSDCESTMGSSHSVVFVNYSSFDDFDESSTFTFLNKEEIGKQETATPSISGGSVVPCLLSYSTPTATIASDENEEVDLSSIAACAAAVRKGAHFKSSSNTSCSFVSELQRTYKDGPIWSIPATPAITVGFSVRSDAKRFAAELITVLGLLHQDN